MRHDFPGNARELENVIEYCFVLCHNGLIELRHLPEDLRAEAQRVTSGSRSDTLSPLQQTEADAIRLALSRNRGHQAQAAKELGISRTTLWRKMNRYGIATGGMRGEVSDLKP